MPDRERPKLRVFYVEDGSQDPLATRQFVARRTARTHGRGSAWHISEFRSIPTDLPRCLIEATADDRGDVDGAIVAILQERFPGMGVF